MITYTENKLRDTLKIIDSSIVSCEKVKPKLKEGSSQFSLNTNRLKALYISKSLLEGEECSYTKDELEKAITQITSIRNKSTTGLCHAKEGTGTYTRFYKIIMAMDVILVYLQNAYLTSRSVPDRP